VRRGVARLRAEEQKQRHIPAILKGENLDAVPVRAERRLRRRRRPHHRRRDGDEWILNGSKIWTTGAWWSDWGLCLARTNWDVPKHRGSRSSSADPPAGIEVHRIEMLNGNKEFCQEFLSDVRVPDSDRIGEVDDG